MTCRDVPAWMLAEEETFLVDRCSVKKKDGTAVVSNINCSKQPSTLTPQEIGLGDRLTTVTLWDVFVSASNSFLTHDPNLLASYRIDYTANNGRTSKLHVIGYMGPQTNEAIARIVCRDAG